MKLIILKKRYWKQLKQIIRSKLSSYILKPYSRILYKRKYKYLADPDKIIYIDTDEISGWYGGNRYSEYTFEGQIKGGDWARRITPRIKYLSESEKYKGITQHFVDGLPWRETDLFKKNYAKIIASDIKVKGLDDLTALENYYKETYDLLFESIKNNGILSNQYKDKIINPIYVNIDADGQILYTVDGNHRLFMCFILGIKKIGVKVWLRHEEWQNKREIILSESYRKRNDFNLELLKHPDIISDSVNA